MNILIDCDNNYIYQTSTLLFSLSKNIKEPINYYFVSYKDVDSFNIIKKLNKKIRKIDNISEIKVDRIDIESSGRRSSQAYIRLLGLLALPESVDRILRLDSDVIVDGDISDYYHSALLNKNIVGTKETLPWTKRKNEFINLKDGIYLNSGVLLFDVLDFKERVQSNFGLEKKIKEFHLSDAIDQDFVNLLYDGNKIALEDDKYMRFCARYHTIDDNYKSNSPVIFHYAGFHRPWKCQGFVNYRSKYWKYAIFCYPIFKVLKKFFLRLFWLFCYFTKRTISFLFK